jgi:hypothetical protein
MKLEMGAEKVDDLEIDRIRIEKRYTGRTFRGLGWNREK